MIPRRLLATALLLSATGCTVFGPSQLDDLNAARARWERTGLTTYEVEVQRLCYCGSTEPVLVSVTDGRVTGRVYVSSGEDVPELLGQLYPAVPGLFDLVADAYRRADDVQVQFDPTFGYPVSVAVDWLADAIDDEVTVVASLRIAVLEGPHRDSSAPPPPTP